MPPTEPFLREALAEAARGAGCVIALPAPEAPVERLLALPLEGPALLWAPSDDGSVALSGRGHALALTGPSLAALAGECGRSLAGLRVLAHPDCEGLAAPRMFGGQGFDARRAADGDEAWAGFPAASLALPRWTYARRGGRACLALALPEGGRRDPERLAAEVRAVLDGLAGDAPPPAAPPRVTLDDGGGFDAWASLVGSALAAMRGGAARKLVAARRQRLDADAPWDVAAVLGALAGAPGVVRFAVQHGDAVFAGATPERLVARRGLDASADALAGSAPRGRGEDDAALADALAASEKDLREHAAVVDGVREALAPHCESIDAPARPSVRTLRQLYHLWTPVKARLAGPSPAHVLALVDALHPTPALGGWPRGAALDWIASHEPAPRGWYGAPVGWCDAAGDGEFYVAIRAAVLRGRRAWAYAGAGLVEGSDAAREWAETEAKMAAARAALGAA